MTKMHIAIELTLDEDEAGKLVSRFLDASGMGWMIPDGDDERYRALKREDTQNVLIGTILVRAIDKWFKTDGQQLQELRNTIEKIASEHNWYLNTRHLPDMIKSLVDHAGREGDTAVKEMKSILDAMISYWRGMEIVAESVSDAGTHKEKDARLRGLLDVIERAIQRSTEFSYEFGVRHYPTYQDLFKSDFGVRDIMRKMREQEAEIKRLKIAAGEAKPEEPPTDDDEPDENNQTFTPSYRRTRRF